MNVSIVIPVYNEEDYLKDCLESIACQTIKPLEVIVVDNNSNDKTIKVAKSFSFVKIVKESKQGVINARTTGFNIARGDIIGRIDADTILPIDWVSKAKELFLKEKQMQAFSGKMIYYNCLFPQISTTLDNYFRRWLAKKMPKTIFLQGANMAIKKTAWNLVKDRLCYRPEIHEDFDLAIHLQDMGLKVAYDNNFEASISMRRYSDSLMKTIKYSMISPKTYALHDKTERFYMYPIIVLVAFFYYLIKFDASMQSWNTKSKSLKSRVNPATYVD